jgi:pimeloyl-ACP methyl ester carboxylesterase
MERGIGGATLKIIRGAGHMSPMEQPAQVTRAISRFVQPMIV